MTHTNKEMLHQLRNWLKKNECDGFVLPVTDEYQGEYSADYARRVTALTGFDGSAGMVILTHDACALLVDGRYTLQAEREVDTDLIAVHLSSDMTVTRYLEMHLVVGAMVAYDPALHTVGQLERWEQTLKTHVRFVAHHPNPLDELWLDQPARPTQPIMLHDDMLAGESAHSKITRVLEATQGRAMLVTDPDAICWLLNIRGNDIPFNPLPLCYALIGVDAHIWLAVEPQQMQRVTIPDVTCHVMDATAWEALMQNPPYQDIGYDPSRCPVLWHNKLQGAGAILHRMESPITLMKACKNAVEQENMRRAHRVDAVAVQAFLAWFDALPPEVHITELDVVEKLEQCRAAHPDYRGASFATIAGAGEHGAIVHYRATPTTNRAIAHGEVLLLDSGGQYPYGTTDITRTMARGCVADDAVKRAYTLVLKGHIALSCAVFPEGTTGHQLDVLARQFLWQAGMDYAHGTGHGVGHYLCVHEPPQSISMRGNGVALRIGMVLSNEPGYYEEGAFGIRIESLMMVVAHARKGYLCFETLTRVPIDTRLIESSLLSDHEQTWLEDYNRDARAVHTT